MRDDLSLDLDDLESLSSRERTRVVAFPAAANSVGTAPDVRRIVELAHGVGALAWADAVHYGPHGPIDVAELGRRRARLLAVQVLRAAHGPRVRQRGAAPRLARRTRCAPRPTSRSATATSSARASTSCSRGSSRRSTTWTRSGWEAITTHERALGERFLAGLPDAVALHGLPTMEGRVPTFCFSVPGHTRRQVAEHLAEREVAVWWGNYYALETIRRLGLDETDGAVRAGIVHYNTPDEVDRLLAGLAELL